MTYRICLCREPPAALFSCERQTAESVRTQFSGLYPQVVSENGFNIHKCFFGHKSPSSKLGPPQADQTRVYVLFTLGQVG